MRCLYPRLASLTQFGKMTFSPKQFSKELVPFQIPCNKCIECRLEYARTWAIRAMNEAQMHEDNIFLTLTYSDENKPSKLNKRDIQKFMKRLRRKNPHIQIGVMGVGEYSPIEKRPHWHLIIFNYRPPDARLRRQNDEGIPQYTSEEILQHWANKGHIEFGTVTFESAGYVARYNAKQLVHGNNGEHDFSPIPVKSNRNAIGKKFIEQFYDSVFSIGKIILPGGISCPIPRYYEDWCRKNQPGKYLEYYERLKNPAIKKREEKEENEKFKQYEVNMKRSLSGDYTPGITKQEVQKTIIHDRFKKLQKHLKET